MSLTKLKFAAVVLVLVGFPGVGLGSPLLDDPPVGLEVPKQQPEKARRIVERGSVKAALVSEHVCSLKFTTIRWIVEDGAVVKKGDRLVQLDDSSLREELNERRIAFDKAVAAKSDAESALTRVRKENRVEAELKAVEVKLAELRLKKSAGKDAEKEYLGQKVRQAQLKLERESLRGQAREEKAEADLKAKAVVLAQETMRKRDVEARVESCVLRAPHDGIAVYYVPEGRRWGPGAAGPIVAVGEPVREGQKLVRVMNLERLLIATKVHENVVSRVRPGQPADVRIDAFPGRVLRGKVKSVADKASPVEWQNGNVKVYEVDVEIADAPRGLKPHMSGEVQIEVDSRPNKPGKERP